MKRLILLLLCCALLTTTVLCASQASSIQSASTVNADGSCQVTMIVDLHLDSADSSLSFPVPRGAKSIRVNNAWCSTSRNGNVVDVNLAKLTGGNPGKFTLTISYTLPGVVKTEGELGQVLTLPLLCGFEYPVDKLEFAVTLPGLFTTTPVFSSGYYQESIESDITYDISGATVTGTVNQRLQDHETLTMRMPVPQELFSTSVIAVFETAPFLVTACIFAGLALIYWLLTLRCAPLRRIRCTAPPAGITAGELGSRLVHRGCDLTTMVLSWAQLGYLIITMDDSGRVFLHKRMDMGNERSAFENHYFRQIFSRQSTVDATGLRFARLCRKASEEVPNARADFRANSGNARLFRGLCICVGAAGGAALGGGMVSAFLGRILLAMFFCAACAIAAWLIQRGCTVVHLRDKKPALIGLGCTGVWLLLNFISGQWGITVLALAVQILGGLAVAYGGRRSELGKQTASEILGFRHYLKTANTEDLKRILKVNPDYYHEMAPYALALGVDMAFAKRFVQHKQPKCTYLLTKTETDHTAEQWAVLLRQAVDAMNAAQKRLRFE